MTMNKFSSIPVKILLLIFLFSCNNKSHDRSATIELSLNSSNKTTAFTQYFDLKRIIRLETSEKSIIGDITKVLFTKDKIFILDASIKGLLVFDYNGDYLFKIQHIGRGPGEYVSIGDVDIDEKEDTIFIVDSSTHKIIKYNTNGNFLSERTCKYPVSELKILNKSSVYYFRNSSNSIICNEMTDFCYNLFIERDSQIIVKDCPFYKELRGYYRMVRYSRTLVSSNNYCYALEPLSNIIYKLSEKEITKAYKIDFGKFEIPESVKRSKSELQDNLDKYYHSIRSIYEDSTTLFFVYSKQAFIEGVFYDKSSYTPKKCNAFLDEKNSLPLNLINVKGVNRGMVSLIEPSAIIDKYENTDSIKVPQILRNLRPLINQNDNPILVLYERQNLRP